jgi:transcriptional regulator with XRE-family HTH domain
MNLRRSEKLPRKLRMICERLGLTAEEFIDGLDIAEWLTVEDIFDFEAGKREPPLMYLLVVAQAAGISTDVLIDDRHRLPRILPVKKKS